MIYPRAALSDLVGDFVVYRGLEPADVRLPRWRTISTRSGVPAQALPRKSETAYAEIVLQILAQAQILRGCAEPLTSLLYLGDTRHLDGQAFLNLQRASGWRSQAYICSEDLAEPAQVEREGDFWVANRWSGLEKFLQDQPGNPGTAAVVDLDKTALGARGRNDRPLDEARVEGVRRAVSGVLGTSFREGDFRRVYDAFNRPAYHNFTGDNQDYLAYLCLMLMSGLYPEEAFRRDQGTSRLPSFTAFLEACDTALRQNTATHAVTAVHREVIAFHREGDPTPFKSFRRQEYQATRERMDRFSDEAPVSLLLAKEIALTGEVLQAIRVLQAQGSLVFCISDKPEEASLPTPELAERGFLPLHRTRMKVLDETAVRQGEVHLSEEEF